MTDAVTVRVLHDLARSYGSLAEPSYLFVTEALAARPYADLIDRIKSVAEANETTDINNDVSFRYYLASGQEAWALNLSMIGPYGLLMRLSHDQCPTVLVGDAPSEATAREGKILEMLKDAAIELLSQDILSHEVELRCPGEELELKRLYHAVISDEPLLPWQCA